MENHIYDPIDSELMCYQNNEQIFRAHKLSAYHRHNAYEIYFYQKGNVNVYADHTRHHLTYGDIMVFSPDELHRNELLDDGHYQSLGINLRPDFVERLSTPQSDLATVFKNYHTGRQSNLLHVSNPQMAALTGLMHQIIDLSLADSKVVCDERETCFGSDALLAAKTTELLVTLTQLYQQGTTTSQNTMPRVVVDTIKYIKAHLTDSILLDDLANELSYSGTYLSTCFKQATGLTLREYILDQRIMMAQKLLKDGSSVQETCTLAGFNDYANFIRSFSKSTGITPGKFRHTQL
ncbi:MAG: AraC family transcriptional regulator [Lactobacillaceae bacterium]|jgi:AraC-like DNA-binding protein|nr:AraC family transcriptional regulator [Lactobacillaceae bacterium]